MAKKIEFKVYKDRLIKKHPELDFSAFSPDELTDGNNSKISVICHKKDINDVEHGLFKASIANLLAGKGCPKCKGLGYTSDERISLCNFIYKGKYDYSKSDFSKTTKKTTVICKKHGSFITDFTHHFRGMNGCPYCGGKLKSNNDEFIKKAIKIHGEKYNYSKVNYVNAHTKVSIICPIHGDFLQTPNAHLNGEGCPICSNNTNSPLEEKIEAFLIRHKIDFIKHCDRKIFEWLGYMHYDFYLPKYNTAIECQGKQHFGLGGWSKSYNFKKQLDNDTLKKSLSNKNNINLVYFTNIKNIEDYLGKVFTDPNDLLTFLEYLYNK